jgi:hypothetical protein
VKLYGPSPESFKGRYSPADYIGARKEAIEGNPDMAHVSTSYVERQNLNMRMGMRRSKRLMNAFSKKFEDHFHMIAPYTLFYNFVRLHKTVKMSPARAAGIEARLWSMEDIAMLMDRAAPAKRGPYKKRTS